MTEHASDSATPLSKTDTAPIPTQAEPTQPYSANEDERVIAHINFPLGFIKHYFEKSPEYQELQQLIDNNQPKEAILLAEERIKDREVDFLYIGYTLFLNEIYSSLSEERGAERAEAYFEQVASFLSEADLTNFAAIGGERLEYELKAALLLSLSAEEYFSIEAFNQIRKNLDNNNYTIALNLAKIQVSKEHGPQRFAYWSFIAQAYQHLGDIEEERRAKVYADIYFKRYYKSQSSAVIQTRKPVDDTVTFVLINEMRNLLVKGEFEELIRLKDSYEAPVKPGDAYKFYIFAAAAYGSLGDEERAKSEQTKAENIYNASFEEDETSSTASPAEPGVSVADNYAFSQSYEEATNPVELWHRDLLFAAVQEDEARSLEILKTLLSYSFKIRIQKNFIKSAYSITNEFLDFFSFIERYQKALDISTTQFIKRELTLENYFHWHSVKQHAIAREVLEQARPLKIDALMAKASKILEDSSALAKLSPALSESFSEPGDDKHRRSFFPITQYCIEQNIKLFHERRSLQTKIPERVFAQSEREFLSKMARAGLAEIASNLTMFHFSKKSHDEKSSNILSKTPEISQSLNELNLQFSRAENELLEKLMAYQDLVYAQTEKDYDTDFCSLVKKFQLGSGEVKKLINEGPLSARKIMNDLILGKASIFPNIRALNQEVSKQLHMLLTIRLKQCKEALGSYLAEFESTQVGQLEQYAFFLKTYKENHPDLAQKYPLPSLYEEIFDKQAKEMKDCENDFQKKYSSNPNYVKLHEEHKALKRKLKNARWLRRIYLEKQLKEVVEKGKKILIPLKEPSLELSLKHQAELIRLFSEHEIKFQMTAMQRDDKNMSLLAHVFKRKNYPFLCLLLLQVMDVEGELDEEEYVERLAENNLASASLLSMCLQLGIFLAKKDSHNFVKFYDKSSENTGCFPNHNAYLVEENSFRQKTWEAYEMIRDAFFKPYPLFKKMGDLQVYRGIQMKISQLGIALKNAKYWLGYDDNVLSALSALKESISDKINSLKKAKTRNPKDSELVLSELEKIEEALLSALNYQDKMILKSSDDYKAITSTVTSQAKDFSNELKQIHIINERKFVETEKKMEEAEKRADTAERHKQVLLAEKKAWKAGKDASEYSGKEIESLLIKKLNSCLEWFEVFPATEAEEIEGVFIKRLEDLKKKRAETGKGVKVLFPFQLEWERECWGLLYIEYPALSEQPTRLYYFDPRGDAPGQSMVALLARCFKGLSFTRLEPRIQYEEYQSGPWVVETGAALCLGGINALPAAGSDIEALRKEHKRLLEKMPAKGLGLAGEMGFFHREKNQVEHPQAVTINIGIE